MHLLCPKCGNAIAGADIDLGRGLAVCRPCGEIVPLPHAITPVAATRLYRPAPLRLFERAAAGRYEASFPPARLAALPALGFCIFWDGFLIVWYAIAIFGGIWPMAIFGLLHLAVGVLFTHQTLVALLNTRRLVIAGGEVSWTSSPVPERGMFRVPVAMVEEFVVHEKSTKRASSFCAAMNLADGTQRELDVSAEDAPSAEYVVERLREALRDAKRTAGEVPYRE